MTLREYGDADRLRLEDMPEPVPGPGQVLIRVEAIAAAYYEVGIRSGQFPLPTGLPMVFGFEAAGTVVGGPLKGQRVAAMTFSCGAWAEYLAAPVEEVTPIPDSVSTTDAVAAATPGSVALALLRKANARGEQVLVEAAGSGGVGSYLVQLAHRNGAAHVTATAGSAAKREFAARLGADLVLDHHDPQWTDEVPRGLGVIFEAIGGRTSKNLLDALASGTGRMLYYGLLSGAQPAIEAADLAYRGLTFTGCAGLDAWAKEVRATRADVLELLAKGRLEAPIHGTFPLEDAVKAQRLVEDHAVLGRVVLRP
ncbi:quinone oxidoreductase family protein [Amycolatopsis alkalitolerans]|nr:zinc-binding dehydrogenase [Amycolatopsis alkalitolerans]